MLNLAFIEKKKNLTQTINQYNFMMVKRMSLFGGRKWSATSAILNNVPGDREIIIHSIKQYNQLRVWCALGLKNITKH